MLLDIKGLELEFNCKLGTTMKIKTKFRKNYNQVIEELDEFDADQLIDLLYCGLNESIISHSDFKSHIYENCGMGDLLEFVMKMMKQIQYPGLSEEEIEKKLIEKKQEADKYR